MAASSTVTGAGVATATTSQISADKAKPASAAISSQNACRGPKCRITPNANRNTPPEAYANNPVYALPPAAAFAAGEVAFIVATHFRRQAGNIIAPARQDLAHDWIDALLTHK